MFPITDKETIRIGRIIILLLNSPEEKIIYQKEISCFC